MWTNRVTGSYGVVYGWLWATKHDAGITMTEAENIDTNMQHQLEGLGKKIAERGLSKDVFLPEWPESKRGTPNSFLRSALFTVSDYEKERPFLRDVVVASQEGVTVVYTGQQLNQVDLTLWGALVHLAKGSPLDDVCEFTAYGILKSLSLPDNGESYARLKASIDRLVECTVTIKQGRGEFKGHLINSALIDEHTHHYKISLGRELIKLYSDNTCTWIDSGERLQLRKKSLAQFLHGYYSSHKEPYPIKVETLHKLSGSCVKSMPSFKQTLKKALNELVQINFIEGYSIEGNLVSINRK
jgi:hypothetical protein